MSGYTAIRLFMRWEKPGRLGTFGNMGIKYATPLIEQQKQLIKSDGPGENTFTSAFIEKFRILIPVRRYYSTQVTVNDVEKSDAARLGPKKKVKTAESPKIMLISETKAISVVTLEEAGKIALKRSLHLIPIEVNQSPVKTEKSIYKLVTNAEFISSEVAENVDSNSEDSRPWKNSKKKEMELKHVMMKSKIAEHDVLSKVKQMHKWIEKGHQVRVIIGQPGEQGNAESIYKLVEENMKDSGARFLQKVSKGGVVRFSLNPPKEVAKTLIKKDKDKEKENKDKSSGSDSD